MIDRPKFLDSPGLQAVLRALPHARLVGGCVRDALAGCPVSDIDLATPDPPEAVLRALAAAGLRAIPTGLDHGTVTALSDGEGFEITTLRRDVTTDGRHAVVAFTDDWRADAARRDFTINAMSMTREGEVFDYFGGAADLAQGRVRFVGVAALRIAEDHLRILRFFRFLARYGRGAPDAEAVAAIAAGVDGLAHLSGERVWSELPPHPGRPRPRRLGGADGRNRRARRDPARSRHDPARPPAARPAAAPRGVAAGSPAGAEIFGRRGRPARGPAGTAPAQHAGRRRFAPPPGRHATRYPDRPRLARRRDAALRARIAAMEVPVFPILGRDLQALGMPPGPAMGEALRHLRATWLDSGCTAQAATLLAGWARP